MVAVSQTCFVRRLFFEILFEKGQSAFIVLGTSFHLSKTAHKK